jgi:hypothetical protein
MVAVSSDVQMRCILQMKTKEAMLLKLFRKHVCKQLRYENTILFESSMMTIIAYFDK